MQRHLIWTIPFLFSLWACANDITTHSAGRLTKPESRVAVAQGGPYQARWQTQDLAVVFDYQWEPDRFDMTGQIELQARVYNFTNLDYLRVRVHFLDAEGVILTTQHLWSAGRSQSFFYGMVNFNFSRQYPPPPGTEIIAFSYTGGAYDAGSDGFRRGSGGGRSDWTFWWRP